MKMTRLRDRLGARGAHARVHLKLCVRPPEVPAVQGA